MRRLELERWAPWIVGVAAGIVYLNTLANGFVFDDRLAVVDNLIVRQPRFLFHAFVTDYWRGTSNDLLYRPLTVFSFGLNHLLHGMKPWGFHLTNVALHVSVSLLVLGLVRQVCANHRLALVTGLLFALHPIHSDAVASIVGRSELLMSLFTLLAIRYYLEARTAPLPLARHKFLSCLICYFLACLSKENGIVAPALILIAEIAVCLSQRKWDRFRGENLGRSVLCYATLGATAALYLLVRFMVLGNLTVAQAAEHKFTFRGLLIGFPWLLQLANALQYFARYLGLLLFPLRLSSDYSFDQLPAHGDIWHWDIGLGALALAAMILAALISIRRAPPLFFGIAFFFIAFLPVSNFVVPIMTILAERTMYLPSVGFLLLVAWAAVAALGERGSAVNGGAASLRRPAVAGAFGLLAVVLAFYSVRTVLRNRDWHDEIALFSSATRACPRCGNAWNCLGDALADAGRFEASIASYNRSLEIIPDQGVFWFRKANALMKWGRRDEAIESYQNAIRFEPQLSDAADDLSRIYVGMGRLDEALRWSLMAVGIQPEKAVFHYNLGYVFQRQRKLREALSQYREAAALAPGEPSYVFNLGLVYRDLGGLDNAVANFQKATELSPANEKYWAALSETLLKKGAAAPAARALEGFIRVSTNATLVARAKEILGQIRSRISEIPNKSD